MSNLNLERLMSAVTVAVDKNKETEKHHGFKLANRYGENCFEISVLVGVILHHGLLDLVGIKNVPPKPTDGNSPEWREWEERWHPTLMESDFGSRIEDLLKACPIIEHVYLPYWRLKK